jgi:hypothetical protein
VVEAIIPCLVSPGKEEKNHGIMTCVNPYNCFASSSYSYLYDFPQNGYTFSLDKGKLIAGWGRKAMVLQALRAQTTRPPKHHHILLGGFVF